jgi:hypothetical protein
VPVGFRLSFGGSGTQVGCSSHHCSHVCAKAIRLPMPDSAYAP